MQKVAYEYKKRAGNNLEICDNVFTAFSMLGIEMDFNAIGALDIIIQALNLAGKVR